MDAYRTRDQRQVIYDQYAASLRDLVDGAIEHAGDRPTCPAAPLCIGGLAMEGLMLLFGASPDAAMLYVSVAVNELAAADRREAELRRRLEVQRGMTADAVRSAGAEQP